MAMIEIDDAVKARLDAIVSDAAAREKASGDTNGMTDYSGALDWAIDMACEGSDLTV